MDSELADAPCGLTPLTAVMWQGDEWEERWSEYYHSGGHTAKTADKWGKNGPNVWHERWGEDYDGGPRTGCAVAVMTMHDNDC